MTEATNKPFCFRCGGIPQYQVELKTPEKTLGVWPQKERSKL